MSDMEILKALFAENTMIKLENQYSSCKATLIETQSPDSSIEIVGIPQDTIIVKIDNFFDISNIFKGRKGECKRADYAIFSSHKNKNRILIIEMKRTKDGKNKIIAQLKGALCFVKYCQHIGRQFWNKDKFLNKFEYRFISIGHIGIRKRKTRITKRSGKHNSPEKMMKIDWPANIRFEYLLGA